MDSAAEETYTEDEDELQRCAMHYTSSDGTRRTLHYRAKEEVRVFFCIRVGVCLHRKVHRIMAADGICQNTHAQKSIAGEREGALSPFLPAPLLATPASLSLPALPSSCNRWRAYASAKCTAAALGPHTNYYSPQWRIEFPPSPCALGTDARRQFGDRCLFTSRCFDENFSRVGGVVGFCELIDSHCFGETGFGLRRWWGRNLAILVKGGCTRGRAKKLHMAVHFDPAKSYALAKIQCRYPTPINPLNLTHESVFL